MKRTFFLFFILVMIFPLQSSANEIDLKGWTGMSISYKLGKAKLKLEEEWRFGSGISSFDYKHTDLGVKANLLKDKGVKLSTSFNFRQVYTKKGGVYEREDRPHTNLELKVPGGKRLVISNRLRLENRFKDNFSTRWRNKLGIKLTLGDEIDLLISDEVFLSEKKGFEKNRAFIGVELAANKNVSLLPFHIWQKSNSKSDHVFGLYTKLKF